MARLFPARAFRAGLVLLSGLALLVGPGVVGTRAAPPAYFDLTASFVPPVKAIGDGTIEVRFTARDTSVHLNEEPAPRVKLDPSQKVLLDKQPPVQTTAADPDTARYLDLRHPVRFPVAFAPGAPKGAQTVKATVVYFFCSTREGWCRRGSTDVDVAVKVQ
jgi:hypothetical protein